MQQLPKHRRHATADSNADIPYTVNTEQPYVPHAVLSTGDMAVNKQTQVPAPMQLT